MLHSSPPLTVVNVSSDRPFAVFSPALARIPDFPWIIQRAFVAPGFLDELLHVICGFPTEQKPRFIIIQPVTVECAVNPDRLDPARRREISGDFTVIDWAVHRDIEELLAGFG